MSSNVRRRTCCHWSVATPIKSSSSSSRRAHWTVVYL